MGMRLWVVVQCCFELAWGLTMVDSSVSSFGVAIKGAQCDCPSAPPSPPDPPGPPEYADLFLGAEGESCAGACAGRGLVCSPNINTGYGYDRGEGLRRRLATFNTSVAGCAIDGTPWWADNQPGWVCGADPRHGQCLGWHGIPAAGSGCEGLWPTMCRVCRCLTKAAAAAERPPPPPPPPPPCKEQVLFEHNVSAGATHGVITQMWHAGELNSGVGDPRMRVYVDDEVAPGLGHGATAAVDYRVALAHGLADLDNATYPFESALFGHTHSMGWFSRYQIPFQRRARVTMQCQRGRGIFWFRVAGLENAPITWGGLQLPSHARLRVETFDRTVGMGAMVDLVDLNGTAGVLTSVNMRVRSSTPYQEGCVQASVDGGPTQWLSSGLEDFFLGSNFHTMPNEELGLSGFVLDNSSTVGGASGWRTGLPNALAAYRILQPDPVLFKKSFTLQWQPHGQQQALTQAGFPISCNRAWPPQPQPAPLPGRDGDHAVGNVTITSYAYVYVY